MFTIKNIDRKPSSPDMNYSHCPVCGSKSEFWRMKQTSHGQFRIEWCQACRYAFVNPRPSFEELKAFYSGQEHGEGTLLTADMLLDQEKTAPNVTIDAARIVQTMRQFLTSQATQSLRFLDVGCGYGFFSSEALHQDFDVCALELDIQERQIAQQLTQIEPVPLPFEDFQASPQSFSGILMSQILEHAHDVNFWMSKAHTLLSQHGILAIALPNFDSIFRRILQERDPYLCPPQHLNFFTEQSLTALLKKHGFKVLRVQWISRFPIQTFIRRFAIIGSFGIAMIRPFINTLLQPVDWCRLGMILNVYATKEKT